MAGTSESPSQKSSRHIGIVMPPLAGHIIPSLGLARKLNELGHRVTYVTHENFRGLCGIVSASLAPTSVLYEGLSSGHKVDAVLGPITSVVEAGNREISMDLDRITQWFREDPIDVLCVGYASQIGYPLADRLGVPRVTVYSTYAWNKEIEKETYGSLAPTGALGRAIHERMQLARSLRFSPEHPTPFGPPSCLNVVSLPRFFQFYPENFDDSYIFMGPDIKSHPGRAEWSPRSGQNPLLYISLGTTYNDNIGFFRSCIEAFGGSTFEVAMSVGNHISMDELGNLPQNFEVRRSFPQISVLQHAHAFLTHAGMGSTMEALSLSVPIIAVPQQGDQYLNARKIRELGIGSSCSLVAPNPVELLAYTVNRIAHDPETRSRIERLAIKIELADGLSKGADAIVSLCG